LQHCISYILIINRDESRVFLLCAFFYYGTITLVIIMSMKDFIKEEPYVYRDELVSVWDYTKVLLLIVIPGFGLIFSFLLAVSKKDTGKLKNLARATLIVRVIVWVVLIAGISVWLTEIWPFLETQFEKYSRLLPLLIGR